MCEAVTLDDWDLDIVIDYVRDHGWRCIAPDRSQHLENRIAELEAALRSVVTFVDGLTYSQLEHVEGLFTAVRNARKALNE